MTARAELVTLDVTERRVELVALDVATDAVSDILCELGVHAGTLLIDEHLNRLGDDGEPPVPDLTIVDAQGRAIVAARLEREPDSNRFLVVLSPAPAPADPTRGRDMPAWLCALSARAARLEKLVRLVAPPFSISTEARLIREALEAIEHLGGDPITAAAIRRDAQRVEPAQ